MTLEIAESRSQRRPGRKPLPIPQRRSGPAACTTSAVRLAFRQGSRDARATRTRRRRH